MHMRPLRLAVTPLREVLVALVLAVAIGCLGTKHYNPLTRERSTN